MFRILKLEIQQYLKEPLIYGFFLMPIILISVFNLAMSMPAALSSVIFIQTILVSLFVYGNKVLIYRGDTLKKKVNNSKLSVGKISMALIIINVAFIFLSLMIPIAWVMIKVPSLSYLENNQWWYFATETTYNDSLMSGLNGDFLLFNSTVATFMQFVYAYIITNFICISFAHLVAFSSKSDVRYFALSIILSIFIILISSIFSKDVFVMTEDAYTQNSLTIKNGFLKTMVNINPFYWTNQMLANTIIGDEFSGTWDATEKIIEVSSTSTIILKGWWTPVYFNIFHVGSTANPEINIYRSVVLNSIEFSQLMTIMSPLAFGLSFASFALVIGEVKS